MDPLNPNATPENTPPVVPGTLPLQPRPWDKPQPQPNPPAASGNSAFVDGVAVTGDIASTGANLVGFAAEVTSGAIDLAGSAAGAVGEVAGAALEGAGEVAGAALEGAGGCADGCAGCSLAILFLLFATAGTAMALFH
ncbi:hypothetical protein VT84_10395 [Gemmata sp. SH-PL17]|uniref:hypothetical protein n=1 Tax=Gemmata sp. SH-PL17 TaxID=1630693 RepID=UPI00078ECFA9|nr:hypothetical protein [Gemmata sp. SH-PL17]AMV24796.1 hypothetical protein VT84_10395 [Gemmata sp. SH-PL17]